ncbi:MAG: cytochrome c biogenesis protein ResB [Chloroflexi bacterium]|nr:cytochrome c biogenesis protein ResB [Chloroflexota bacterium]
MEAPVVQRETERPRRPRKASTRPTHALPKRTGGFPIALRALYPLWHLFCTVRLGLIVILLLAVASLAGSLIIQAPSGLQPGSPDYAAWLLRVRPRFGVWTNLMSTLQLFSIFSSFWFKGLLLTLVANIVICTLNRSKPMWRTITKPPVRVSQGFFQHAGQHVSLDNVPLAREDAAQVVSGVFRARGYHIRSEQHEGRVYLYGDKHRFAALGTFAVHLSLVFFLVGALVTITFGSRDDEFVVAEGSTGTVAFAPNLLVYVDRFADEYYPEGPPKDYYSDVVLYDNGVEVKRQTIRVNEPMEYQGVRFHQSFFGPAVVLEVRDGSGSVVFRDGVPLAWRFQDRPVGLLVIPGTNLVAYVVGPVSGQTDPSIGAGQVRVEVYSAHGDTSVASGNLSQQEPQELAGLTFTFLRERQFTGLQVVKDPGSSIVWIASFLLIMGLILQFYFPRRRVWAVCNEAAPGRTEVAVAATASRNLAFAEEFQRLVAHLTWALKASSQRRSTQPTAA